MTAPSGRAACELSVHEDGSGLLGCFPQLLFPLCLEQGPEPEAAQLKREVGRLGGRPAVDCSLSSQ